MQGILAWDWDSLSLWKLIEFVHESFLLGQALGEIIANFLVNPTLLRVVRVARVGRVLRLVKGLFSIVFTIPIQHFSLLSRSERNSNSSLCISGINACSLQHRSSSVSGDVYLFHLWHVLLCLRSKNSGCD